MGRKITVDIVGDATKFNNATKSAQTNAQKFGKSIATGLGIGAGIGAFNLLSSAVSEAKDALGDATRAAMADESSQAKLRTSLAANVQEWDGNTAAIEDVLKARMELGFSDDEQRESLSLLVAKTGDVTKALDVQRSAMDLARLKGIGLAEASKAVALGMGGSGRALKELGIDVKDYANETEILAAIQKKAAGQAEAYGETTAGVMTEAQVALDEASEAIGYRLLPIVKDLAVFVRDNAVPAVEGFTQGLDDVATGISFLGDRAGWLIDEGLTPWDSSSHQLTKSMGTFDRTVRVAGQSVGSLGGVLEDAAKTSDETSGYIVDDNKSMQRSYVNLANVLLGQYTDNFDRAMDITEARADLHAAKNDVDRAQAYADLAEAGALSAAGFDEWAATLERLAAASKGKVHTAYLAALADIRALRAAAANPVNVTVNLRTNTIGNIGARASGGPATGLTWVGEEGPELVDLPSGSYVNSNARSMQMARSGGGRAAGGGRGDIHVHIDQGAYIDGPSIDRLTNLIAQRLNYATGL